MDDDATIETNETSAKTVRVEMPCVLCACKFEGLGNNALPVKEGLCCDTCNRTLVVPERLLRLQKETAKQERPKKPKKIEFELSSKFNMKLSIEVPDLSDKVDTKFIERLQNILHEIRKEQLYAEGEIGDNVTDVLYDAVDTFVSESNEYQQEKTIATLLAASELMDSFDRFQMWGKKSSSRTLLYKTSFYDAQQSAQRGVFQSISDVASRSLKNLDIDNEMKQLRGVISYKKFKFDGKK
jgi:hypothetical protein